MVVNKAHISTLLYFSPFYMGYILLLEVGDGAHAAVCISLAGSSASSLFEVTFTETVPRLSFAV